MFWFYYIMLLLGTPCGYSFLWRAIQPGEMFGFWQRTIKWAYGIHPNLSDFIGSCQICFSHFIAWVSMGVFIGLTYKLWPFGWFGSGVFVIFNIAIVWWLSIMANQWLTLIMYKQFLKSKEVESYKEQYGE